MNIWQIARQLGYLIDLSRWDDGTTRVFAEESIVVTDAESVLDVLDERLTEPIVLIIPSGGPSDPQHGEEPDLLTPTVTVVLVTRNLNLRMGEGAFIGANREGINDSRGRGVLEIAPKIASALKRLTVDSGVVMQNRMQGDGGIKKDFQDSAYAIQETTFEVVCTSQPYYTPCRRFLATPRTGEVTLTWKNPPARYDRYRVRLLRKSGAVAPTSITDGTVLAAGATSESFVDSGLAAGTYSYSVFMTYDDFSNTPGTDLRVSAAATDTSVVVP